MKYVIYPTKGKIALVWCVFSLFSFLSLHDAEAIESTIISDSGYYRVHFSSVSDDVPLRRMQAWRVYFSTTSGKRFIPKQLSISGGMPGHGHGFPSEPKFTQHLGGGELLLEGLLFNMPGLWEIRLTFSGASGLDHATLRLELPVKKSSITVEDIDLSILEELHIRNATKVIDPSNRFLNHPKAIKLGEKLFFDPNLSANKDISCASCHQPGKFFTDGRQKSHGSVEMKRHTPTLIGVAHAKWFYWDGRRDSLWAQAITPIETPGEMDNDRGAAIHYVLSKEEYRSLFIALDANIKDVDLAELPVNASPYGKQRIKANWNSLTTEQQTAINSVYSTLGKSLAAYVSTFRHANSDFDHAIDAISKDKKHELKPKQIQGLKLFLDAEKTHCMRCHNGPLLTNHGFHNIGTGPNAENQFDFGRMLGLQAVNYDTFNCQGNFSDAPTQCDHFEYAQKTNVPQTATGAFKVPSLRNVRHTAPYMHDGRFENLEQVIRFYTSPPDVEQVPHELPKLELKEDEIESLIEFLKLL